MYILQITCVRCAGFLLSGTFWTSTDGSWSPMNAFVHDIYIYIMFFFDGFVSLPRVFPLLFKMYFVQVVVHTLIFIICRLPETSSRFPVNIPGCEFAGPRPVAPRGVLPHVGYFSCCEQHTQDPTHAASLLTALTPLSPPHISLSL